jgi:hypothetical protein
MVQPKTKMPANDNERGRPNPKITTEGNRSQNQHGSENQGHLPSAPLLQGEQSPIKPGKSHEQLVKDFKSYIDEQQQTYQTFRSHAERETWPSEEIIRKRLDVQSGATNEQEGEFFSTLRYAWDALVYDRYKTGSQTERLAGSTLWGYYQATQEPTIKLIDPVQVRMMDAMTEAVGIPYEKGQAEIEIPEKLRQWNKWTSSQEYLERGHQAQSKPKK